MIVPSVNSIENRLENALNKALQDALGVTALTVHLGFISDYDANTPATKQRAIVVGLSFDDQDLMIAEHRVFS